MLAFITSLKFTVTVVIVVLKLLFGNRKSIQTIESLAVAYLYTFIYTF